MCTSWTLAPFESCPEQRGARKYDASEMWVQQRDPQARTRLPEGAVEDEVKMFDIRGD